MYDGQTNSRGPSAADKAQQEGDPSGVPTMIRSRQNVSFDLQLRTTRFDVRPVAKTVRAHQKYPWHKSLWFKIGFFWRRSDDYH